MAHDRPDVFWRNASGVLAGNHPARNFCVRNELRCRALSRRRRTWTLAEYVVHRFVLHGLVTTQHWLHHANPDAAVLNVFWQIWACFALIYLIAGGAFLAGGLFAYS
jgi:hypothetical protein